ncbi:MAG: hypothetical protein L3J95_04510 [Thermoplasmata archaeon]|nr:hypothetical protein [Thermoplasmata archaeon]MCI4359668.1 hypothetical protein [Thermoplasmata archaeon]
MRRSPPPRHRLTEAEVAGFREGVAHALRERRRNGDPDPGSESDLAAADRELAAHSLRSAETLLVGIHDRLRAAQPETEVTDRPRGLVSFVASGPPDQPVPAEEDRLRNRILLVTRLAAVRRRSGAEVAETLATLASAFAALERGDRSTARSLVDAATDQIDRSVVRGSERSGREPVARDR